jgi:hypothetical protein
MSCKFDAVFKFPASALRTPFRSAGQPVPLLAPSHSVAPEVWASRPHRPGCGGVRRPTSSNRPPSLTHPHPRAYPHPCRSPGRTGGRCTAAVRGKTSDRAHDGDPRPDVCTARASAGSPAAIRSPSRQHRRGNGSRGVHHLSAGRRSSQPILHGIRAAHRSLARARACVRWLANLPIQVVDR